MTRRDHAIVGVLVLLLVGISAAVALPVAAPSASPSPTARPSPATQRPYREGILGRATSVSPFAAQTQADRDLVALLFRGLVRLGPNGSLVPDLAVDWSSDPSGAAWTFTLRDDARWHDGEPVTAEDVAFTIRTLQAEGYNGPGASSWQGVTVTTEGTRTVRFQLATPVGGFLQAATQPIAPAHLLGDVPVDRLADDPFNRQPVGSGPFVLSVLDAQHAILQPAALAPTASASMPPASQSPGNSFAAVTPPPGVAVPYLTAIELRFFGTPGALAAAYTSGELDAVAGLPPAQVVALAGTDTQFLRYPSSTLTAVALNLRADHPAFRNPAVRRALLQAIDRDAVIRDAFAGLADPAAGLIPSASWAFDPVATVSVATDRTAAAAALAAAGWKQIAGHWAPPGATSAPTVELLSADAASNAAAYAAAERVIGDWTALGLLVRHVAVPPAELVDERLRTGHFDASIIDVNLGLDPDLYPLLGSTQVTAHGSNVAGLQDRDLDTLLLAARAPGPTDTRKAAFAALERRLSDQEYLLPLAFRDVAVAVRDTVLGRSIRQVSDPADRFWDVLTWRLADAR